LHRHALAEIARFIDVAAKLDSKMIGKKLKWNNRQDRHYAIVRLWQGDNFIGNVPQLLRAVPAGECNDGALTSFDLLHVIHVFRENRIVRHDKDRWKIRTHQRDDAVLELGARMAFGEQISDLLHLESAFECDWKIELAAKEKHAVHIGVFPGNGFNLIAQFQGNLDLRGQRFQRLDDPASFRGGKISHPAEEQTNERENDQLRSKGLRGRDSDLRSGVHINATVAFARNRARDVVANSQGAHTFAPAFTQSAECIRSFAALADGEHQSL